MSWCAPQRLGIALYNYADLPPELLQASMKIVSQSLGDVGIRPAWSVCLNGAEHWVSECGRHLPPPGRYVVVNLMRKRNAPALGPGLGYEVAGFAIQDSAQLHGARAFAFYDSVTKIADKAHRRPAAVLACVLLHEIAHTLGLRHDERGVMRALLDPHGIDESVQGLAFDGKQGRQLRSAVEELESGPEVLP
jgi:hypothetical protein